MNPIFIKNYIRKNQGKTVIRKVFGLRNKVENIKGVIKDIYPQIFTVKTKNGIKSFSYSEIISKDIKITVF